MVVVMCCGGDDVWRWLVFLGEEVGACWGDFL
jgi:hypothetical protein